MERQFIVIKLKKNLIASFFKQLLVLAENNVLKENYYYDVNIAEAGILTTKEGVKELHYFFDKGYFEITYGASTKTYSESELTLENKEEDVLKVGDLVVCLLDSEEYIIEEIKNDKALIYRKNNKNIKIKINISRLQKN